MIELADVKTWLSITTSTHDDALTALEARAAEAIERELDWYFGPPRPAEEILNGTNTDRMFLRQPPVDGVDLYNRATQREDWELIDPDEYEVDGRGLFSSPAYRFVRGRRNFRAVYQEGFAEPPADIVQVVLELIAGTWRRRGKEGVQTERIGDYNFTNYTLDQVRRTPAFINARNNWRRGRV